MRYECRTENTSRREERGGPVAVCDRAGARGWRHLVRLVAVCGLVALTALLAGGCGKGRPSTIPVKGVVIYKGQPLQNANVMFVPVAGGRPASGRTGEDGTFSLGTFKSGDGALPGEYLVGVAAVEGEVDEDLDHPTPPEKLKRLIPEQYGAPATSGLKATVAKGAEIRIEIP